MSVPGTSIDVRHPTRPPVLDQINSLAIDLARLCAGEGRPARGVGLAAAHAALRLAVTPAVDEDEQMIGEEVLADAVQTLAAAGFAHLEELVAAALSCSALVGQLQRGNERLQ